jgi:ribosomal protein S18 acetylase RimI-like enzyme
MTSGKVIQGYFVNGRPKLPLPTQPNFPPPPIQAKTAARPPGPPAPAYVRPQPVVQPHGAGDALQVDLARLGLTSGGGQPLPDAVRGRMEAALGADFSDVRVHVGPQAERIGAIAFTLGSDIYFAPGRYQPDTMQGQQVLGHELAHILQQRAGRVRNPRGTGVAVVQDRALEAEADRMGHRAASHVAALQPKMSAGVQPASPVRISAPLSAAPGSYRLTAGAGGRQVGSVMVHARGRGAVEVTDLNVDPAHREHGIGRRLLASAARTAQQIGKSRVTLAAQDNGSGHLTRWYKEMGFTQKGVNRRGYPQLEAPASRLFSNAAQGRMEWRNPFAIVHPNWPKTAGATQYAKPALQRVNLIQRMEVREQRKFIVYMNDQGVSSVADADKPTVTLTADSYLGHATFDKDVVYYDIRKNKVRKVWIAPYTGCSYEDLIPCDFVVTEAVKAEQPKHATVEIKVGQNQKPDWKIKYFTTEGGSKKTKGQVHVEKHGEEFGIDSTEYRQRAVSFANGYEESAGSVTVIIGKTFIRYSPSKHWVVVCYENRVRTFYIWDRVYSNPISYAICVTLIKMGKGLEDVDSAQITDLKHAGYDLEAMMTEIATKGEHQ